MNSFVRQPFVFEAMISKNPVIKYEWRKNAKPIDQSLDNIKVNRIGKRSILSIESVNESQAGVYSLVSNNSNARDEASFNLAVLPVHNSSANLSVKFYIFINKDLKILRNSIISFHLISEYFTKFY
jgi:hypothetical protein